MSLIPLGFWKSKQGIVTDGLILHLDANTHTSGNTTWTNLVSGGSNVNLYYGATAYNQSNGSLLPQKSTAYGGSVFFSRDNASFAQTILPINNTTPNVITVEFWGKLDTAVFGAWALISFVLSNNFYLIANFNGGLGFNTGAGDGYGIDNFIRLNAGSQTKLCHFAFVMYQNQSYTNNEIYINGIKCISTSKSQFLGTENASNRNFGNGLFNINGFTNSFFGDFYVGIFRIYNRILTDDEIINNYNTEALRFDKNLYLPRVANNNLKLYYDFKKENEWFGQSGDWVKNYSTTMVPGNLNFAGWNSNSGGIMQFISTGFINTILSSSQFGLFLGSASFVTVVKSINQANQAWVFGPDEQPVSRENVRIGIGNNRTTYTHETGNPIDTFSTFGTMNANQWYHIVYTYNINTTSVDIYINGVKYVNGASQASIIGNRTYLIGRASGVNYSFDLGLFMIYDRVLSQPEVTETYNIQRTRFGI